MRKKKRLIEISSDGMGDDKGASLCSKKGTLLLIHSGVLNCEGHSSVSSGEKRRTSNDRLGNGLRMFL